MIRTIGAANIAVIGLWALSRTVGLPGEAAESVGVADTASTVLEAVSIAGSVALSGRNVRGIRRVTWVPVAAMLGVSVIAGAALGAVPATSEHDHLSDGSAADHEHVASSSAHLHGLYGCKIDPCPTGAGSSKGRVDAVITKVGEMPTGIAQGFGKLWVTDRRLGTLTSIDPITRATRSTVVGTGPSGVATGYGAVWVTDFSSDTLVRIDPTRLTMTRAATGSGPTAVAIGPDGIWVTSVVRGIAQLIDARSLKVLATIPVGYGPTGIAVDARNVWVVNTLDRTVVRIDAGTKRLIGRPIDVGAGAVGVTTGFGRIWVASSSAGTVDVIDPTTDEVRRLKVDDVSLPGQGPIALTVAAGRIWVANNHDKTIRSIEPSSYAIGDLVFFATELARSPIAVQLAYERGSLWITNSQDGTVRSIGIAS
jgi:DNA-binding beta-propeller fold protein YncE